MKMTLLNFSLEVAMIKGNIRKNGASIYRLVFEWYILILICSIQNIGLRFLLSYNCIQFVFLLQKLLLT